MSFLSKIGQDLKKDQKLVILRKKYFHDILQFNQNSQQLKKDNAIKQKYEANSKILKMNTETLKAQQSEKTLKLHQKLVTQMFLKSEYDKQIQQKRQMKSLEKQIDKTYIKLQQIQTDKASDRRLRDLMKIYERAGTDSSHRRAKTQALQHLVNPEQQKPGLTSSRKNLGTLLSLPPIQRQKNAERQLNQGPDQSLNQRKSERVLGKRTLF